MNLCIDQGNSRTKVAIIGDEGKLLHTFIYKSFASADVERLFSLYPITDSIISSVINIEPAVVNSLHRLSAHFILFDHKTPIPIRNGYDTPETLGQDRLAAAVGAVSLCPNENLLIIDAGSAITYDYVSADGTCCGAADDASQFDQETASGGSRGERVDSALRQEHAGRDSRRRGTRGGV